jgi:hypothetical protein
MIRQSCRVPDKKRFRCRQGGGGARQFRSALSLIGKGHARIFAGLDAYFTTGLTTRKEAIQQALARAGNWRRECGSE